MLIFLGSRLAIPCRTFVGYPWWGLHLLYDWTEQDTEICQTAKQMGGSKMWIIWGFGDCVNLRHLHKTRKREHFSCDIVAARYRLVRRIDVVPKDVIWWLAQ